MRNREKLVPSKWDALRNRMRNNKSLLEVSTELQDVRLMNFGKHLAQSLSKSKLKEPSFREKSVGSESGSDYSSGVLLRGHLKS